MTFALFWMTLIHDRLPSAEPETGHKIAWDTYLPRLAIHVAGGPRDSGHAPAVLVRLGIAATIGGVAGYDAPGSSSKAGTVGRPELFMDMKVVDGDDKEVPPGEPGEIVLCGPQVMSGYWNQPEASAQTLRNGWLHTGDVGSVDGDGFLRVLDRLKDMLISGGLNVYSAEVERALAGCPGISEIAVIGVPDARWDEVPLVVARVTQSFDPRDLQEMAQRNLADYKRPKYLVQVAEPLPRNASGKIMKPPLRQRWPQAPADAHILK